MNKQKINTIVGSAGALAVTDINMQPS
jgi:hypothetical protein